MGSHACERESCIHFAGVTLQPAAPGGCERVDAAIAEFERGERHRRRAGRLLAYMCPTGAERVPGGRIAFMTDAAQDAHNHEQDALGALLATVPSGHEGMLHWLGWLQDHIEILSEPDWVRVSQLEVVLHTFGVYMLDVARRREAGGSFAECASVKLAIGAHEIAERKYRRLDALVRPDAHNYAALDDLAQDAYCAEQDAFEEVIDTVPSTMGGMCMWMRFLGRRMDRVAIQDPRFLAADRFLSVLITLKAFVCAQEEAHHG